MLPAEQIPKKGDTTMEQVTVTITSTDVSAADMEQAMEAIRPILALIFYGPTVKLEAEE